MPTNRFFFLGFDLDESLKTRFSECKSSDRAFLEDPMYLESMEIEGTAYIGRRLDDVLTQEQVEDTSRNVCSLIARVVPGWSVSPSQARLIAVEEEIVGKDVVISE